MKQISLEKTQVVAVLAVAMTIVVVGALAATLLTVTRRIPNDGNLKAVGVGIYWDEECTTNVTSINWGYLQPGDTTDVTVYAKNEGTTPIILSMTHENWDPTSASQHITITWNRENYTLSSGYTQALLTLSVAPNTTGIIDFSFDMIITGTELA